MSSEDAINEKKIQEN